MSQQARELKAEIRAMGERIAPIMSEFCDGYIVIGMRAGMGARDQPILQLMHACGRSMKAELEDEILAEAERIVRQRQAAQKRRRKTQK